MSGRRKAVAEKSIILPDVNVLGYAHNADCAQFFYTGTHGKCGTSATRGLLSIFQTEGFRDSFQHQPQG
jgi:hypothetical protein